VGQYRDRKIHQIDPKTGAIMRTIESNRFVTGVTWVDGELWHGTWEGDESDIRRVDPESGACSSGWRCLAAPASAGSSPTGQTCFIAAANRAERSARCDVRKERHHERPQHRLATGDNQERKR